MQKKFKISSDGTITAIYSDSLSGLIAQSDTVQTVRASHVEPLGKEWIADMSPVSGPVLGPFPLRETALQAETEYLDRLLF